MTGQPKLPGEQVESQERGLSQAEGAETGAPVAEAQGPGHRRPRERCPATPHRREAWRQRRRKTSRKGAWGGTQRRRLDSSGQPPQLQQSLFRGVERRHRGAVRRCRCPRKACRRAAGRSSSDRPPRETADRNSSGAQRGEPVALDPDTWYGKGRSGRPTRPGKATVVTAASAASAVRLGVRPLLTRVASADGDPYRPRLPRMPSRDRDSSVLPVPTRGGRRSRKPLVRKTFEFFRLRTKVGPY